METGSFMPTDTAGAYLELSESNYIITPYFAKIHSTPSGVLLDKIIFPIDQETPAFYET
jgi:hypothetical protein